MIFVCFTTLLAPCHLRAASAFSLAPLRIETVPAPARRATPEELLGLEAAAAALVTHHALAMRGDQAFLHLQEFALLRAGVHQFGLKEAIERAQAGITTQLLACELARCGGAFGLRHCKIKSTEHVLRGLPCIQRAQPLHPFLQPSQLTIAA